MIRELKPAGYTLTDEQQVQAVIHSLPDSWETMKQNLTHSESIKTFTDVSRHVELEAERIESARISGQAFVAEGSSSKNKNKWFKKGKGKGNEANVVAVKNQIKKKGKKYGQKPNSRLTCFNRGKKGHFSRDCTEPKKVDPFLSSFHEQYVASIVLLADQYPLWIVDSGATNHVARDRATYVEYRRVPAGNKWIYVGNNARIEVKGIGTCKLNLRGGGTLFLHDVLYAPEIRRNLVSVICLLDLGYNVNFYSRCVELRINSVLIGYGFVTNGFMLLDVEPNNNDGCFSNIALTSNADVNDEIWHARLGHIGQERMNRLAKEGLLGTHAKINLSICEHCLAGRLGNHLVRLLGLIHHCN